jgi:hypothetical protein
MPVIVENRDSGWIKIPLPYILDQYATLHLFQWECMVKVFWCIPASLGTVKDKIGTWSKLGDSFLYVNKRGNFNAKSQPALIWMLRKKHDITRWLSTFCCNLVKPSSFLILFGSLRHNKMGSRVEFVPESCRKVGKQKLDFDLPFKY